MNYGISFGLISPLGGSASILAESAESGMLRARLAYVKK
jgi:hypothetical protein